MKIDPKTPLWCVTDPGPDSALADVCFQTTLDGLRRARRTVVRILAEVPLRVGELPGFAGRRAGAHRLR